MTGVRFGGCPGDPRGGRGSGVTSRLLLVGLLFVRVACSVLHVGGAGAQPVEVTTVLCIVDVILEEHLGERFMNTHSFNTIKYIQCIAFGSHCCASPRLHVEESRTIKTESF